MPKIFLSSKSLRSNSIIITLKCNRLIFDHYAILVYIVGIFEINPVLNANLTGNSLLYGSADENGASYFIFLEFVEPLCFTRTNTLFFGRIASSILKMLHLEVFEVRVSSVRKFGGLTKTLKIFQNGENSCGNYNSQIRKQLRKNRQKYALEHNLELLSAKFLTDVFKHKIPAVSSASFSEIEAEKKTKLFQSALGNFAFLRQAINFKSLVLLCEKSSIRDDWTTFQVVFFHLLLLEKAYLLMDTVRRDSLRKKIKRNNWIAIENFTTSQQEVETLSLAFSLRFHK